jgi:adenosylcobinamide-GDP ribazoletransferase
MVGILVLTMAARRLIGGFTGDVLGAVEQIAELGLVMGLSAAGLGR